MKKISLILAAAFAPVAAVAADLPARTSASAPAPAASRSMFYVEGQMGAATVKDVDTITYSGSAGGYTFTNFKGTVEYKNAFAYGAEVGMSNVMGSPFRVGLSYAGFKAEVNKISGSGTVAYGGNTYNLSATVTRSQINSGGTNFDNQVNLYMANAYYDFSTGTPLRPFVGVGVGVADIEHATKNQLALSATVGAQYDLTSNVYVGGKLIGYRVNGPKDELGVEYKAIMAGAALVSVGMRF